MNVAGALLNVFQRNDEWGSTNCLEELATPSARSRLYVEESENWCVWVCVWRSFVAWAHKRKLEKDESQQQESNVVSR